MRGPTPVLLLACICCLATKPKGPEIQQRHYATAELGEIYEEMLATEALRGRGQHAPQTPEFIAGALSGLEKINAYTRTHTEADLDVYWQIAFQQIYEQASAAATQDYGEAEAMIREGLALLKTTKAREAKAPGELAVQLVAWHLQHWDDRNPVECAALWDELGEEVMEVGNKDQMNMWQYWQGLVEVYLLRCVDGLSEDTRIAFLEQRGAKLRAFLEDENIPLHRRTTTMRTWLYDLSESGHMEMAAPLIDTWWRRYGDALMIGDYYYARLWVSLFLDGDWEKASETVRRISLLVEEGKIAQDDRAFRQLNKVYYDLIFVPGIELKRAKTAALANPVLRK